MSATYINEYLKITYSPDNGYEVRFQKNFKTRRFSGKANKKKVLISSGKINYFMTEGIDSDNIYNEEALDLYMTLTF